MTNRDILDRLDDVSAEVNRMRLVVIDRSDIEVESLQRSHRRICNWLEAIDQILIDSSELQPRKRPKPVFPPNRIVKEGRNG